MQSKLGRDVLEKIKEEKIKPKPKWFFITKNFSLWFFFSVSVLLGSIAVSLIIFMLKNSDWDLYDKAGHELLKFVFLTIPYFWVVVLLSLILISYYNYRHTKIGYKRNPLLIVLFSVLVSVTVGSLLYIFGIGALLEESLEKHVPPYSKMFYQNHAMWNNPEKGLIGGKIIVFKNVNNFKIISLNQKEWDVLSKDPVVVSKLVLKEGKKVKVIGEVIGDSIFAAEEIRPFVDRRLFFERNKIEMRIR